MNHLGYKALAHLLPTYRKQFKDIVPGDLVLDDEYGVYIVGVSEMREDGWALLDCWDNGVEDADGDEWAAVVDTTHLVNVEKLVRNADEWST